VTPRAVVLGAVLLAAGCAHSPEPLFYALSTHVGAAHPTRALVVELRRPSLPAYLDRQHIVRRATAERLDLGGDQRWAGPLDELTSNVLVEDLSARLPSCFVIREGRGVTATPDVRVELEISRFERDEYGRIVLDALVAVQARAATSAPLFRHEHFASAPAAGDVESAVAGMSATLGALADAIATIVAGVEAVTGERSDRS